MQSRQEAVRIVSADEMLALYLASASLNELNRRIIALGPALNEGMRMTYSRCVIEPARAERRYWSTLLRR